MTINTITYMVHEEKTPIIVFDRGMIRVKEGEGYRVVTRKVWRATAKAYGKKHQSG
jgi:hypothetical protein